MIYSSPLMVLSIVTNISKAVNKKSTDYSTLNIYKLSHQFHYDRSPEYIKQICKKIYNDIENHFYSYRDLALFIACDFLYNQKNSWKSIDVKNINIVKEMFTESRFLIDQQTIIEINKKTGFEKLSQYFQLNSDGISVMYDLVMHKKHFISPLFYLKYEKISIQNDVDFIPSECYIYFIKLTKLIKNILTTKT